MAPSTPSAKPPSDRHISRIRIPVENTPPMHRHELTRATGQRVREAVGFARFVAAHRRLAPFLRVVPHPTTLARARPRHERVPDLSPSRGTTGKSHTRAAKSEAALPTDDAFLACGPFRENCDSVRGSRRVAYQCSMGRTTVVRRAKGRRRAALVRSLPEAWLPREEVIL